MVITLYLKRFDTYKKDLRNCVHNKPRLPLVNIKSNNFFVLRRSLQRNIDFLE